jgi:hypothetical protein
MNHERRMVKEEKQDQKENKLFDFRKRIAAS